MKTHFTYFLFGAVLGLAGGRAAEERPWTSMFNGRDLAGWKSNEEVLGVFTVVDGVLRVSGGRAHLFYMGPEGTATFRNFEFKAKVMTMPGANSGIYFHTQFEEKGWPSKGYECQVNTSHYDRSKTGGLYGVKNILDEAPSRDNEWFDCYLKVEGRRIVIQINGKTTVDWTEPADWDPDQGKLPKRYSGRRLGEGTIALQGNGPKQTACYRDLFIRKLP